MRPIDTIGMLMDYESGALGMRGIVELFAELIRTGVAWKLQGSYGRMAQRFIVDGYISEFGDIDWERLGIDPEAGGYDE